MAQKCFVCKSSEVNDLELGEFLNCDDVHVHYFCLLLTTSLQQNGEDDEGLLGFLVNDVKKCVVRLKKNNCYVCRKPFANIECSKAKCSRKFHTLCGLNRCLSIFTEKYMSFCEYHHHLPMKDAHNETETCLICYDAMGQFNSITSIQPNCCKSGWMHKKCVAHYAKNSGYFCKCPLCNNDEKFRNFIAHRGIYIPDQDAAWELEPNAFAELQEGPKICQATNCCAFSRSIRNKRFRMKACTACGSYNAHIKCWFPNSRNFGRAFICNNCTVIINHNNDEAEAKVNQTVDDIEPIVIEDDDRDTNIRRRNVRGNTYLTRTRSQRIFCDSDSDSSEPVVKELRGRKIKLNTKKVFDEKSEIIKTLDKKFPSTSEYFSNNSRESLDIQNEEENQDMEKIRRQKTTTDNSDDSDWEGGESYNNSNIKQKEVRKLRDGKIKINMNEDYDMQSETSHSIDSNCNSSLDFQIQSTSGGHRRKKRTRLNMANDYNSEDLSNESDSSDWALSTIKRYKSSVDLRDSSDYRPKSRQTKRSSGILTDISNDNGNSPNSMFGGTPQKNMSDGSIRSRQTNKNPIKERIDHA